MAGRRRVPDRVCNSRSSMQPPSRLEFEATVAVGKHSQVGRPDMPQVGHPRSRPLHAPGGLALSHLSLRSVSRPGPSSPYAWWETIFGEGRGGDPLFAVVRGMPSGFVAELANGIVVDGPAD